MIDVAACMIKDAYFVVRFPNAVRDYHKEDIYIDDLDRDDNESWEEWMRLLKSISDSPQVPSS